MSAFVRSWSQRAALSLCGATLSLSVVACGTDPADPPSSTGNNSKGSASNDDSEDDETSAETPVKPSKADAGKSKPVAAADAGATKGGSSEDKTPTTPATGGTKSLWCDALAVFADKCQVCHGATLAAGAPMSLLTYADATGTAKVAKGKMSDAIKSRVHDTKTPMPPGKPLDAAALAAIDAWVADGAKPGDDPTCAGQIAEKPAADDVWPPEGCDGMYKVLAGNGKDVMVPAGQEVHPQFTSDAPWGSDKVQAIGFRPVTDNKAVLHHWILNGGGAFISGWAPGQDDSERKPMPKDVGIFLPNGAGSLRMDMHYNNLAGTKAEPDQSGVEICVTHQLRKYTSTTFSGFAGLPNIPAGKEVDTVGTCNVSVKEPVFLLSESPHAHKLATHMKFVVKRNGMETVLHDAAFAFDGQVATPLKAPFELKTGDQVITTCHFKNDTNKQVGFGENTGNEMCFNFATYYPMGALSCSGGGLLGGAGSNPFGGNLFGGQ